MRQPEQNLSGRLSKANVAYEAALCILALGPVGSSYSFKLFLDFVLRPVQREIVGLLCSRLDRTTSLH